MARSLVRFFRLGLRTNPFYATDLTCEKEAGPGTALARELWTDPPRVLLVMGQRGAGKTHLVEWLLWRHREAGRRTEREHLERPRGFPGPGRRCQVYALDEAQRARPRDLSSLGRWVAADPSRMLLVTSHEDVSHLLGPCPVRCEELSGVARADLDLYLERRLAAAALPGRESPLRFDELTRRALLVHCRGNFLRLADLLYQVCEDLPESGAVDPDSVARAAARIPRGEVEEVPGEAPGPIG